MPVGKSDCWKFGLLITTFVPAPQATSWIIVTVALALLTTPNALLTTTE
jgi:hypothetical protein